MFIQTSQHAKGPIAVRVNAHKYRDALGEIAVRLGNAFEVNLTLDEATTLRDRLDAAAKAVNTGTFPVGSEVLAPTDAGGSAVRVVAGSFTNFEGVVMVTFTDGLDAIPATSLSQLWATE